MSSKIWLINLILAAAVVFFGIKAYRVWSEGNQWPVKAGSIQKPVPLPDKKILARSSPPETEYEVVVSNNLFSLDRNEAAPQAPAPPTEVKKEDSKATGTLLKVLERFHQRTNLYGVVIVGDHREALIDSIPAKLGVRVVHRSIERARVGDTLGMFKVKEIGPTTVVLTAGGYEWPVSLFDKDKPKKRVPVKKAVGPVVIGDVPKVEPAATPAAAAKRDLAAEQAASKKKALESALHRRKAPPVPNVSRPDMLRRKIGETGPRTDRPGPEIR